MSNVLHHALRWLHRGLTQLTIIYWTPRWEKSDFSVSLHGLWATSIRFSHHKLNLEWHQSISSGRIARHVDVHIVIRPVVRMVTIIVQSVCGPRGTVSAAGSMVAWSGPRSGTAGRRGDWVCCPLVGRHANWHAFRLHGQWLSGLS